MTAGLGRFTASSLGLVLLVLGLVTVFPVKASAATITGMTFNNISRSTTLNANPESAAEVDDVTVLDGERLYLPASANPETLSGWIRSDDGTQTAFTAGDYDLTAVGDKEWSFTLKSDPTVGVTVYQSGSVPTMYIKTTDGLAAIEADKNHADVGGSMAMIAADATPAYNGLLGEMKGRGNTTWAYPKKPYQIKLDKSTELVASAGTHKTWILLANYLDASLIRNEVAYGLEGSVLQRSGRTDHAIKGRMIDLYVDGGFRGSYYLAEKVQVGPTRVNITDLEKANETANPGTDLGSAPTVRPALAGQFAGLKEAQYTDFPNSPSGYDKSGYLFEMDFASGSRTERSYFITRQGTPFTVKAPEDANAAELAYASGYMQDLEDAIFSVTGKNAKGKHYTDYLDLPSFANYYAVQEAVANEDAFKSSTYFYMDGGGKLMAGPLWDCDRCLASLQQHPAPQSVHVGKFSRLKPLWIKQLLSQPDFRTAVQTAYKQNVLPELDAMLASGGTLSKYANEVAASAKLNKLRWAPHTASITSSTPAGDITWLRSYLNDRRTGMTSLFGTAAYTSNVQIPEGIYTIRNGRLDLDVQWGSTETGANVQLWDPNTSDAQRFRVTRGTDSFYTITNVRSGKLLDVQWGAAASGTNVWQYPLSGTKAQKWTIGTYDGVNYTIASALGILDIGTIGGDEDGYVLDAAGAGTTAGTNIQIWRDNGTSAQRFAFTAPALPPPPPTDIVENQPYALASKLDRAKVVDVAYASQSRGTNIQLYDFNGSSAQRFTLRSIGDGTYQVLTGTGGNGAVDVAYAGTANGTNVWQWDATGSLAQQWVVRATGDGDGSYYLVSRATGLHLDVSYARTANGTNIWTWPYTGTSAQKFYLNRL